MMLCPIVPTTIVTSFMTASVKRFERFERLERFEPVPEFNSFFSSFIPPPSSFALDIHPMHIPASRSGRRSRLKNRIKPRQIFFAEFDLDALDILLQMSARLAAGNRNDVVPLGQ